MSAFRILVSVSIEKAVEDLMEKGQTYSTLERRLVAGQDMPEAVHPSDAWIIFGNVPGNGHQSRCQLTIGAYTDVVEAFSGEVAIVHVPAGNKFAIRAINALNCLILKKESN